MLHPEIMRMLADDHIKRLQMDAAQRRRARPVDAPAYLGDVEIRLCKAADDPQLEELAELNETALPFGRLVVAIVRGRVVAAVPLAGGRPLTDPFVRTEHLVPLLDLHAEQLRHPRRRRFGLPHLRRSYAG